MKSNEVINTDKIAELLHQTALNIHSTSEQMGILTTRVKVHDTKFLEQGEILKEHGQRIQTLEDDSRITRSDAKRIRRAVIGRVNVLLEIEFDGGKVAEKSIPDEIKYRQGFIARCYTDAKRAGVLAEAYTDTPRKDFDAALRYIEKWFPEVDGGTEAYKKYLDIRREERKKAKNGQ